MVVHQDVTLWGHPMFRTFRCLWMLEELDVPFELVPVNPRIPEHPRWAEFAQLNPHGKIPVLQDGTFLLRESVAINSYLGDKHGKFVPQACTPERSLYEQWCLFVVTELDASIYIHRKHVMLKHIYGEAPQAVLAAREYFTKARKRLLGQR